MRGILSWRKAHADAECAHYRRFCANWRAGDYRTGTRATEMASDRAAGRPALPHVRLTADRTYGRREISSAPVSDANVIEPAAVARCAGGARDAPALIPSPRAPGGLPPRSSVHDGHIPSSRFPCETRRAAGDVTKPPVARLSMRLPAVVCVRTPCSASPPCTRRMTCIHSLSGRHHERAQRDAWITTCSPEASESAEANGVQHGATESRRQR